MNQELVPNEQEPEELQRIKPLEERILGMVQDTIVWNFKTVQKLFPGENEKSIYRALKRLENGGRIRFAGWSGRTKQYTTYDVSNLPVFRTATGREIHLKEWPKTIAAVYNEHGVWRNLEAFNEFPILLSQIFVTATLEDKELLENYREIVSRLGEMRNTVQVLLNWLNTLLDHHIMSGDPVALKNIVAKEQLTIEELNEFKRWYTQFVKRHNEA
jgi:hypothetical protein